MKNLLVVGFLLISISVFSQSTKLVGNRRVHYNEPKIISKCNCEKSIARYRDQDGKSYPVYLNLDTDEIFYLKKEVSKRGKISYKKEKIQ